MSMKRVKIELPEEEMLSPGRNVATNGRADSRTAAAQEFTSAAASSSPMANTGIASIVNGGSEKSNAPFVS